MEASVGFAAQIRIWWGKFIPITQATFFAHIERCDGGSVRVGLRPHVTKMCEMSIRTQSG